MSDDQSIIPESLLIVVLIGLGMIFLFTIYMMVSSQHHAQQEDLPHLMAKLEANTSFQFYGKSVWFLFMFVFVVGGIGVGMNLANLHMIVTGFGLIFIALALFFMVWNAYYVFMRMEISPDHVQLKTFFGMKVIPFREIRKIEIYKNVVSQNGMPISEEMRARFILNNGASKNVSLDGWRFKTPMDHDMYTRTILEYYWNQAQKQALIGMKAPFQADNDVDKYIFVSYAHNDKAEIYPILHKLHEIGLPIWYDEGIPVTKQWEKMIIQRINLCRVVLVFISPAAMQSSNVQNEILHAMDIAKPIVPVYLSKTQLGERLLFKRFQDIQGLMKFELDATQFWNKLLKALNAEFLK